MCSLGHHDHAEDVPAPNAKPPRLRRRRIAGTFDAILASMPAAVRQERKAKKHAQLLAEVSGAVDMRPEPDGNLTEQYELLPPGADLLPDHLIDMSSDKMDRRRRRSADFLQRGEVDA